MNVQRGYDQLAQSLSKDVVELGCKPGVQLQSPHTLPHVPERCVLCEGEGTFPEILDSIPKIFTRNFPLLLEGWCFLPFRFSLLPVRCI